MSKDAKIKHVKYKEQTQPYTKATFLIQIVMTILALLFISPIFIVLNYSFKTKKELYLSSPLALPQTLHFDNYIKAFVKLDMVTTFTNTLLYTAVSVLMISKFPQPGHQVTCASFFRLLIFSPIFPFVFLR
jgi:raffinose/stachyose/melibiose transport system permease protein